MTYGLKNGNPAITYREAWLRKASAILGQKLFAPAGFKLPEKFRVSVGFPRGRRGKGQHAIGQCWSHKCSKDRHAEIFISPELDDPSRVCDVLIHEIVHAIVGCDAGHGREFRECALAVGLEGKMTATVAGEELKSKLGDWLHDLPEYPHRGLIPMQSDGPKKQGTRLLKIICEGCGWTGRTTAKWVEAGLPTCACGDEIKLEEEGGGK